MKIWDVSCFYGPWATFPVRGAVSEVAAELSAHGITTGFISPLASAWCGNQQAYNRVLLADTRPYASLSPTPVLDPTLPTWRDEVEAMRRDPRVRLFRLLLNYSRFDPAARNTLDDCFRFFNQTRLPFIIQKRMEDPRYHHHRAVVPDVEMDGVIRTALKFPDIRLVLGGVSSGIRAEPILRHQGLYLDTSQMDGMACIRRAIDQGLLPRLVFGSHIPLFETASAFARVLNETRDDEAERIFTGNMETLLQASPSTPQALTCNIQV